MAVPPEQTELARMSESEYLDFERQSEERHEFVRGKVLVKEPGGWEHGLIAVNTSTSLHQQLEQTSCVVVSMMMRLRIDETTSFRYPDIMVICDKPQLTDKHNDNITNPSILIEVLIPETELEDRETKLHEYITIDSLQEYILISQHNAKVEVYSRDKTGKWIYTLVTGLDASVDLQFINCKLELSRLYDKTDIATE